VSRGTRNSALSLTHSLTHYRIVVFLRSQNSLNFRRHTESHCLVDGVRWLGSRLIARGDCDNAGQITKSHCEICIPNKTT